MLNKNHISGLSGCFRLEFADNREKNVEIRGGANGYKRVCVFPFKAVRSKRVFLESAYSDQHNGAKMKAISPIERKLCSFKCWYLARDEKSSRNAKQQ